MEGFVVVAEHHDVGESLVWPGPGPLLARELLPLMARVRRSSSVSRNSRQRSSRSVSPMPTTAPQCGRLSRSPRPGRRNSRQYRWTSLGLAWRAMLPAKERSNVVRPLRPGPITRTWVSSSKSRARGSWRCWSGRSTRPMGNRRRPGSLSQTRIVEGHRRGEGGQPRQAGWRQLKTFGGADHRFDERLQPGLRMYSTVGDGGGRLGPLRAADVSDVERLDLDPLHPQWAVGPHPVGPGSRFGTR